MKLSVFLLSILLSSQCFAWLAASDTGGNVCSSRQVFIDCLSLSPLTTTFPSTMFVLDSGEEISLTDKLSELEAEIKAGPESYYYLIALAKQVSAEQKYNGDIEAALNDVIAEVKALLEIQKSSSTSEN